MKTTIYSGIMAFVLWLVLPANAAQHFVSLNNPAPAAPFTSWATAATNIQDAVDAAMAGDEVVVSNGVYQTGAIAVYGMSNRVAVTKPLFVHSVNGSAVTIIRGYQVPGTTNGPAAVRCAYLTNGAMLAGFTLTNGATQDSGDDYLQKSGGGVWCESISGVISNCVLAGNAAFAEGGGAYIGTLNNCVLTSNSVFDFGGGAEFSILNNCILTGNSANYGGGTDSSTLNNCTLSGNFAAYGGGDLGSLLTNCTLTGNSAVDGGGALGSTLNNCTLSNNFASYGGGAYFSWSFPAVGGGSFGFVNGPGAAYNSVFMDNSASEGGGSYLVWNGFDSAPQIYNCTLTGNQADYGGGLYFSFATNAVSSVVNSIIYYNLALDGEYSGDNDNFPIYYCCTTPLPSGIGNFTSPPSFVKLVPGNYHLQTNSPCINAGLNVDSFGATDLDGNPRVSGGTVDIGAYEFQNPTSVISYAWLQHYGLRTCGCDDLKDSDNDGLNNYQEWIAGTDPTNSASGLRLLSPMVSGQSAQVSWTSVSGRTYSLLQATNLAQPSAFSVISSNIPGLDSFTSLMDTNATGPGPVFYRIRVEGPVVPDAGSPPGCPPTGCPSDPGGGPPP